MMRKETAWFFSALMLVGGLVPTGGASLAGEAPDLVPALPLGTSSSSAAPTSDYFSPFGVTPEQVAIPNEAPADGGEPAQGDLQPVIEIGSYGRMIERLALDKDLQVNEFAAVVADYLAGLGFGLPGAGAAVDYEDNASLSYSHPLGDIDGDGIDDLLLDQYCVDSDACRPKATFNPLNPRGFIMAQLCYWPHRILAVSGRDGHDLWNATLDHNVEIEGLVPVGCQVEFIVGTVPDGANHHPVIYRWQIRPDPVTGAILLFSHFISVLDAKTGAPLWTKTYEGSWIPCGDPLGLVFCLKVTNLFVQPILQVQPEGGVNVLPGPQKPSIILQGVGFNITATGTPPPSWAVAGYLLYFGYFPHEWAAGIEPMTGVVNWARDTFLPNGRVAATEHTPSAQLPDEARPYHGNRSFFPLSLQDPPLPHTHCIYDRSIACPPRERQFNTQVAARRQQMAYWGARSCCYDVNGDEVPDLAFTVYEWSSTPTTNYEGPFTLASRLVFFDGKTGTLLYDIYRESNLEFRPALPGNAGAYQMRLQSLGDVDGDKATDYLLHETYFQWDFMHNVSIISGKDGKEVWRHADKREFVIIPLGDANKDGSIDVALLNFTMDISFYGTRWGLANVTVTPLRILNGGDGSVLWAYEDFSAPTDIRFYFLNYLLNGLPDFDEDGVGDLLADDPLFLPDLTKVHRLTYLAGGDGRALFKFVTAGEFAFPNLVGDVNGDGVEDLFLLNGDVTDLWGTTFDGKNGTAIWSRRVITSRNANYFMALPFIRTHPLHRNGTDEVDYAMNMHFFMLNVVSFGGINFGFATTKPQLMVFGGLNGTIPWAIPVVWDQNLTVVVDGLSPASKQYVHALEFSQALGAVPDAPIVTPIQVVAGVAMFGAAFGTSFLLSSRRLK